MSTVGEEDAATADGTEASSGRQRQRNQVGEGHRLRDELIDAARRLLEANGGDERGLSLRAVARETGVAAPSIYPHFESLGDLVWAVSEVNFRVLNARIDDCLASTVGAEPRLRLQRLAACYCEFALEHPGTYRTMFEAHRAPKAARSFDQLPGRPTFAAFVDVLTDLGSPAPADDALLLWSTLHGAVTLRASMEMFPFPPIETTVNRAVASLVTN